MRYQISAATLALILMLIGYIVYSFLTTPNLFSTTPSNSTSVNTSINYTSFSSMKLLGEGPFYQNYTIGTLQVYSVKQNKTIFCSEKSVSASIFSSYNLKIPTSNYSNDLFLVNATPTSGNPTFSIYSGNSKIFSTQLKSPITYAFRINSTYVSLILSLNGLAFSQSALIKYCIVKQLFNQSILSVNPKFIVVPGLGKYIISFTPIGKGIISVYLNNNSIYSSTFTSNSEIYLNVPNNFSLSPNLSIVSNSTVTLANLYIDYYIPVINSTISNFVNIPFDSSGYSFYIYVDKVIKPGNITVLFPNAKIIINSSEIQPLISYYIPSSYLIRSGNYSTGNIKIYSNGLFLIQKISISKAGV
ncbi:MAG: hypothetical protein QW061_02415 [Candidatus Rehaiarchaeum fermentans]|nr:hypothetical protein [Candidatus Rehaiarchaeum fermentans]MCW1297497.1 hypothetical protein [Candidatus Rehaiarchaeum fermentans]